VTRSPSRGWGTIPAALLRGGTSRGVLLPLEMVPPEGPERDRFLIELMGSDDPGQADGLGGNTSTTSKVMMVSHEDKNGGDIRYLFAQVDSRNPVVDYGGNCGNMTAAVALYAVTEGLVPPRQPHTEVLLVNLNTGTRIRATVPSQVDGPEVDGDFLIAGVSAPGPEIVTEYLEPAGRRGQFPTGAPIEILKVPGVGEIEVSIVDISSPLLFIRAADVGLTGDELPEEIDGDARLLENLEAIRGEAAVRLGFVERAAESALRTPGIPKLTMVSPPREYRTSLGTTVEGTEIDILARIMSVQRAHHAYAMTGALCTAAATRLPGTIPHSLAFPQSADTVRIGHPKGVTTVGVSISGIGEKARVEGVSVSRTARYLMRGTIQPRKLHE
jgi:2-methylaconitate isomerase